MTKPLKLKGFVRGRFEVQDKSVVYNGSIIVRLKTIKSAQKLATDLNNRLADIQDY